MAFGATAAVARRAAAAAMRTMTQQRTLKTSATRSLQQAVVRQPFATDEQEILAGGPWPLTMLTEEENMFKDSGALLSILEMPYLKHVCEHEANDESLIDVLIT